MKDRLESRVMRIWVSSLLDSDLTASELKKISELIRSSPNLMWDLADILQDVSSKIGWPMPYGYSSVPEKIGDFDEVYALVRNKKLSRRRLWEIINSVSPKVANTLNFDAPSVNLFLMEFFDKASINEWLEFKSRLDGRGISDPYLEGISKERK